jgi:gliding motility-associated-like protein
MKKYGIFSLFLFSFFCDHLIAQCTPVSSQTNVSCNGANDGAANVAVAGGPFTYTWSNGANTPSISNLGPGNYSVTINSAACTVSGIELVTNGNFSAGNTGFSSAYAYTPPGNWAAAQYWVGTGPQVTTWNGGMVSSGDHTSGTGNLMMVNGSGTAGTSVWCQTIPVTANTTYNFSTWVSTLFAASPAQLQFSINGISLGPVFNAPAGTNSWVQFFSVWNSGANTSANICIVNQNTASGGNDFGLDDISFQSCSTCSATANFTITEPSAVSVTVTSTNGACGQAYGTMTASASGGAGNYSYAWSIGGQTAPTATATAGLHSVLVTDLTGCTASGNTNVSISPPLNPVIASNNPVCENGNILLSGGGGLNYSWNGPNGFSSAMQNPVITNCTAADAGTYTLTVSSGTCTSTIMTNVNVNPIPTPVAAASSPVCVNNQVSFTGAGGVFYSWSGPNGFFSSAQNPSFTPNLSSYSGNYTLTVSDNIGCSSSTVIPVVVNPLPSAYITADVNKGCIPFCTTFNLQGLSGANCSWSFGNGGTAVGLSSQQCFNKQGTFSVTANFSDASGCFNFATYTVQGHPKPIADFNYAPYYPIANTGNIQFIDASHGAPIKSWTWYFDNTANNIAIDQHPEFAYSEAGNYEVVLVVKSSMGCYDTIIKSIPVGEDYALFVPNTFTPNEDGVNDIFQPKGFGITQYNLEIFDRWGEKVFHTNDFSQGWDGKYHSKSDVAYKVLPLGDYSWKIVAVSVFGHREERTGHVTLMK